jgi:hypothetical protein
MSGFYKTVVFLEKRMAKKELIEIKDLLPKRRQWNTHIVLTTQTTLENVALLNRDIPELVYGSAAGTVSQDPRYPHL